jgi:hypothetical protein
MLTDDEIRHGYLVMFGREITEADLNAFKRALVMFCCTQVKTFEEGHKAIGLKIESWRISGIPPGRVN